MPAQIRKPSRLKSFFSSIVPSRVKNWWIRRQTARSLRRAQIEREPEMVHDEVKAAARDSLHKAIIAQEMERQRALLQEQLRKHVQPKERERIVAEEGNTENGKNANEERNAKEERNVGEE